MGERNAPEAGRFRRKDRVFHRGGPAVPAEEILLNLLMEALTLVLDPEYSPLPVQSQGDLDGLSLGGEAQGIG